MTAGEHGEFSRVVFAVGSVPSYRVEPRPDGLRVRFPGASFEFDFSAATIVARTHRITRVGVGARGDGSAFDLSFDCDCSSKTFVFQGKLVVDVFNVPPDRASRDSAENVNEEAASVPPGSDRPLPKEPEPNRATEA